jgi:hypothetical protein
VGKRFAAAIAVVGSACAALHYSTTEQHAVTIANSPYTFNGPGSQIFTVSPAGSGNHDLLLAITPTNCNSQWVVDTSIDPQQPVEGAHVCGGLGGSQAASGAEGAITCPRNYQFDVRYAGTLPGSSSCNVRIDTMVYGGSTYGGFTLVLGGVGSGGSGISLSPRDINFGDVQINTTSLASTVLVKNEGSATVTVNSSLSGTGFQVSPAVGSAFGLGSGSSRTFAISCAPLSEGSLSGALQFTSGSQVLMTALACNGIDSTVTVAPSQVTFDSTLIGRAPANKIITIGGNGSAIIESVSLDATALAAGVSIVPPNPEGQSVGSGKTIVLAFAADATHEAGPLGLLSVKLDVDEKPRNIGIAGEALLGGVGLNPASVELGAVCVGSTATKSVEVYASEPGSVIVQSLTKPAAPFDAVAVDTLPKALAGNHFGPSATVRASMSPTAAGTFDDKFILHSDVPMTGTTEVQLHGIGLAEGIAATPDIVHFGTTGARTTTSPKEVQLTNCGTADLMFERVSITGDHADEFTLLGAYPAQTLAPTESMNVMVIMQPESPGFKTAQLVLEHSEGTTTAVLDGTGEGGEPKNRETYYACNAGSGATAWPIALALLLLRRRRRT